MKSLNDVLQHSHNLPTVPEVVLNLIKTFDDPTADTDKITRDIALDPVLTARVLRLANSAFYGIPRTVGSLNDAAMVLGFQALRTLVVAGGLAGAFRGPPGYDLKPFWKQSFATAGYADWLAGGFIFAEISPSPGG